MQAAIEVNFVMGEIEAKRKGDWNKARLILLLILVMAALSGIFFAADLLRFQLLTDAQSILSILTPLFLFSLFVERAVEVVLTVWRGREADDLALAIKQEEETISLQKNADRSKSKELQSKLTNYKGTTRDIAFMICFILGVLISMAGIRALALFVDPTSLDDLSTFQTGWFTVLDIFVTGALIGGGSDGVHKFISMVIALLDSTKSRAQARA